MDQSVQMFLDHLKVERRLSPATVAAYGQDVGAFVAFAMSRGHNAVGDVMALDLLEYLGTLATAKLGARSQARKMIALRQFFRFLKH